MPVRIDLTADRLAPVLPLSVLRDIERRHADQPLMDRAGAAAASIAVGMLAHHRGPVAVLAGPGNNGGDGCACARRLHASGFDVTVAWAGDPSRLSPAAAAAYAEASAAGVRFVPEPPSRRPALVVDGLFGIGLSRPVAAPYDGWIEWANAQGVPILALDVPSGLDAATGVAHRPTIAAAATATFIALKPGLLTLDGPDHCGELSVHDLGLDLTGVAAGARLEWRPLAYDLPAILARRTRKTHKGTFGRACVVGGAEGLVGAALLAGRAAIRLGAGRVVVGIAARNPPLVDWASAELMLREAANVGDDYDAWVVGPGLGNGERANAIVARAVRQAQPLVLDADALNAIAVDAALRDAVAQRTSPTLATPHPAEAARLLGSDTAAVQADRVGAATDIARTLRAHVVLKGVGSIVARPDGSFDINTSGNPALSTAGSGDVLAGILGALLAQGIAADDALRIGVCVHGAAADALVAEGIGPLGVTASELIDAARALVNEATRKPAKR
jgi:hydroxyethylthiazole kinase-like uncharacterized protein yjeF